MAEYGQNKLDLHQWQEKSDEKNDVKIGYDKLEKFMKVWDEDYWSKVGDDETSHMFCYCWNSNNLIFLSYVFSMKLTYECSLYYAPEYGIPVSGQVLMDPGKALKGKINSSGSRSDLEWIVAGLCAKCWYSFQEKQQTTDVSGIYMQRFSRMYQRYLKMKSGNETVHFMIR